MEADELKHLVVHSENNEKESNNEIETVLTKMNDSPRYEFFLIINSVYEIVVYHALYNYSRTECVRILYELNIW